MSVQLLQTCCCGEECPIVYNYGNCGFSNSEWQIAANAYGKWRISTRMLFQSSDLSQPPCIYGGSNTVDGVNIFNICLPGFGNGFVQGTDASPGSVYDFPLISGGGICGGNSIWVVQPTLLADPALATPPPNTHRISAADLSNQSIFYPNTARVINLSLATATFTNVTWYIGTGYRAVTGSLEYIRNNQRDKRRTNFVYEVYGVVAPFGEGGLVCDLGLPNPTAPEPFDEELGGDDAPAQAPSEFRVVSSGNAGQSGGCANCGSGGVL